MHFEWKWKRRKRNSYTLPKWRSCIDPTCAIKYDIYANLQLFIFHFDLFTHLSSQHWFQIGNISFAWRQDMHSKEDIWKRCVWWCLRVQPGFVCKRPKPIMHLSSSPSLMCSIGCAVHNHLEHIFPLFKCVSTASTAMLCMCSVCCALVFRKSESAHSTYYKSSYEHVLNIIIFLFLHH